MFWQGRCRRLHGWGLHYTPLGRAGTRAGVTPAALDPVERRPPGGGDPCATGSSHVHETTAHGLFDIVRSILYNV